MDDLISRQDAIDSIMEEPSEARYPVFYAEKIRQLPSAQPEIVRCKDCKWYDLISCGTLTPNAHRCKRVTRLWFEDDAYCSYGERRE